MQGSKTSGKRIEQKKKEVASLAKEYDSFRTNLPQKQRLNNSKSGKISKYSDIDETSITLREKDKIKEEGMYKKILCSEFISYNDLPMEPLVDSLQKLKNIARKKKIYIQIPPTVIDLQNPNNVILIRNDPFFGYISVLKYPKAKLNNLLKKYLEDQSTSKLIPNFVVKDVQFPGTNLQVAFRTSQIKEKMSAARGEVYIQKFLIPKSKSSTTYRAYYEKGQIQVYMISAFEPYKPIEEEELMVEGNQANLKSIKHLAASGHLSKNLAQSLNNLLSLSTLQNSMRTPTTSKNPALNQKKTTHKSSLPRILTSRQQLTDLTQSPYLKWGEEKPEHMTITKCRKGAQGELESMAAELIKIYTFHCFYPATLQIYFMALDFIQDKDGKFYFTGVKAYKSVPRLFTKVTQITSCQEPGVCYGIFCKEELENFSEQLIIALKRFDAPFSKVQRQIQQKEIMEYNIRIQTHEDYYYEGDPSFFPLITAEVQQIDSANMKKESESVSTFGLLPVCETCYQIYTLHIQKKAKMSRKSLPNQIKLLSQLMDKREQEWKEVDFDNLIRLCLKDCIVFLDQDAQSKLEVLPILSNKYSKKEKNTILKQQHDKNNYFGYSTPGNIERITHGLNSPTIISPTNFQDLKSKLYGSQNKYIDKSRTFFRKPGEYTNYLRPTETSTYQISDRRNCSVEGPVKISINDSHHINNSKDSANEEVQNTKFGNTLDSMSQVYVEDIKFRSLRINRFQKMYIRKIEENRGKKEKDNANKSSIEPSTNHYNQFN